MKTIRMIFLFKQTVQVWRNNILEFEFISEYQIIRIFSKRGQ